MNEKNYCSIHRFHDKIAIYLNTGETIYLSNTEAREIGKHLIACAKDVETSDYLSSRFSTFRLNEES